MFFKKSGPPNPPPKPAPGASEGGAPTLRLVSDAPTPADSATAPHPRTTDVGLVLDALGSVLAAFARFTFDLPEKPAHESAAELSRWQRHATLGVPMTSDGSAAAIGVHPRDWTGVVRSFSEHRRAEKRFVDSAVTDLRDALWACIHTVHKAVKVDVAADATVGEHMQRARRAIAGLEIAVIKEEVLGALSSMESALHVRRSEHESQFRSLASRLDLLRDQLEEARLESSTDALTSLGNRKLFDQAIERAVQYHSLSRSPVCLLLIDVDALKAVNDTHGHQAGDAVIMAVGSCLSKVFLRQSDTVCRFGGDEFAAILPSTDAAMAQTLAKRLLELVSERSGAPAETMPIGVSIGVAELQRADDARDWIARADAALYQAKQAGRGCAVIAPA